MDKTSSIIAALDAGKLPSTQQFGDFLNWLNNVGITNIEPLAMAQLSSQGRVLANDLRRLLEAYKLFLESKNDDNLLQEAIWHLEHGDLAATSEAKEDQEQALKDIHALRRSLRVLIKVAYRNVTTEGTHIFGDFASVLRIMLADAAELVETHAGKAKETLRHVERDVQEGRRDSLGRNKEALEARKGDAKLKWEHGVDTVKDTGSMVIGASKAVAGAVEDTTERTTSRIHDAFYSVCDRAQSDPAYREALDTIFDILQKRLDQGLKAVSDPNFTFGTFIGDPTPEQHVPNAIECLKTFIERVADVPLDPMIRKFRVAVAAVVKDEQLKSCVHDFLGEIRRGLTEKGYARSDAATDKLRGFWERWNTLLEKDEQVKGNIESMKDGFSKALDGMKQDKDLQRIRSAHTRFNNDISEGLIDASATADSGLQAAIEQVTWFWQDAFRYYLPRILERMKDIPIPRIEYKDSDIEFVLENIDVSSFRVLPSHIYIRNITDVDINAPAEPSESPRTAVGALTHIRLQAVQLDLNNVSFWYKDKTRRSIGPNEFTGLMEFNLPEKGLDLDLKLRLIPATVKGPYSRENLKHFNVIERVSVTIAEDIGLSVKESNHSILVRFFKSIMTLRLREALERTLTEQVRAAVEWADGVAFDIGKRKEVFQDTGVGGGVSLMAAIWSEAGRLRREGRDKGELGIHATGTGIVVEQQLYTQQGEEAGKTEFALGAEPQILSGEKRGPLGTGSAPLRERLERVSEDVGIPAGIVGGGDDVREYIAGARRDAKDMLKDGKRQFLSFRRSVEQKTEEEKLQPGWRSSAFDV